MDRAKGMELSWTLRSTAMTREQAARLHGRRPRSWPRKERLLDTHAHSPGGFGHDALDNETRN
jgi:hypothetical protein